MAYARAISLGEEMEEAKANRGSQGAAWWTSSLSFFSWTMRTVVGDRAAGLLPIESSRVEILSSFFGDVELVFCLMITGFTSTEMPLWIERCSKYSELRSYIFFIVAISRWTDVYLLWNYSTRDSLETVDSRIDPGTHIILMQQHVHATLYPLLPSFVSLVCF